MDVKNIGKSTYQAGAAMDSLAKTDDMLAVIGIIMLLGVIVSSYGAFWQGRLAQASYNSECKCEDPKNGKVAKKKNGFLWIGVVIFVLASMGIIYIFIKKPNGETAAVITE